MNPRIHPFEAVENVRDYGGYDTAASQRLASGRLFRSGHWAHATDEDLARFRALGIGTVVDLRRATEREHQPSRRPEGCVAEVLTAPPRPDDLTEAPHVAFLKSRDLTPDAACEFMTSAYRRIPYEAPHLDLFGRYFRALADSDRPVLIHCAAGKDRTGILAALTHRMVGVHADDMIEDYVLTNAAVRLEERAPEIAERMQRWSGRPASPEAVIAFVGVEPGYLDVAFAEIDRQSGSLDGYFETALGLNAATRARIVERLTA